METDAKEMRLIIPKGCDNAPRKRIVIDFTVAILQRQMEYLTMYAHESIVWDLLKQNLKIEGYDSFIMCVEESNLAAIDCLEVFQVITHGKFASINGVLSFVNGEKVDFCDVYTFSNNARTAKIKEIKTYQI